MRALFTQFSGLVGILTFLNQLMRNTPLDKTIFLGLTTGMTVYLVLILGDLAIHRILATAASSSVAGHQTNPGNDVLGSGPTNASKSRAVGTPNPDAPPVQHGHATKTNETLAV